MCRVRTAVGILLVLLQATLPASAADEDVLSLEGTAQSALLAALHEYKPKMIITKVAERQEIDHRGNFGKLMYIDRSATYSLQDNGLWAIAVVGTSSTGSGASLKLSLCGLVTLIQTAAGTSSWETPSVVPFKKLFLPFGIRSTLDTNIRIRLKSFETSAKNICAPTSGSQFTYRMDTERQLKTSGPFGGGKVVNHTYDVHCSVGRELKPASEISSSLRGGALPVVCESTAGTGEKIASEYAFLQESGLYVMLTESTDIQTSRVAYKDVQYTE